jgi:hypothetical protein
VLSISGACDQWRGRGELGALCQRELPAAAHRLGQAHTTGKADQLAGGQRGPVPPVRELLQPIYCHSALMSRDRCIHPALDCAQGQQALAAAPGRSAVWRRTRAPQNDMMIPQQRPRPTAGGAGAQEPAACVSTKAAAATVAFEMEHTPVAGRPPFRCFLECHPQITLRCDGTASAA